MFFAPILQMAYVQHSGILPERVILIGVFATKNLQMTIFHRASAFLCMALMLLKHS